MLSFDLKSGYHHVEIFSEHQKFLLSFAWKSSNGTQENDCVCTVLPFGLSTAPYIFTKLLKPLKTLWRLLNIDIALFLDDGCIAEKNF